MAPNNEGLSTKNSKRAVRNFLQAPSRRSCPVRIYRTAKILIGGTIRKKKTYRTIIPFTSFFDRSTRQAIYFWHSAHDSQQKKSSFPHSRFDRMRSLLRSTPRPPRYVFGRKWFPGNHLRGLYAAAQVLWQGLPGAYRRFGDSLSTVPAAQWLHLCREAVIIQLEQYLMQVFIRKIQNSYVSTIKTSASNTEKDFSGFLFPGK